MKLPNGRQDAIHTQDKMTAGFMAVLPTLLYHHWEQRLQGLSIYIGDQLASKLATTEFHTESSKEWSRPALLVGRQSTVTMAEHWSLYRPASSAGMLSSTTRLLSTGRGVWCTHCTPVTNTHGVCSVRNPAAPVRAELRRTQGPTSSHTQARRALQGDCS